MPDARPRPTESAEARARQGGEIPYSQLLSHWLRVSDIYLKCQQSLQRDLRPLELSLAQHDVLVGIRSNPGLTQRELADVLYVVKSNVTSLLKKLETRGLVTRTPDQEDARVNRLTLTAAGDALAVRSLAVQRQIVSAMMGPISAAELTTLGQMMERVGQALDAHASSQATMSAPSADSGGE